MVRYATHFCLFLGVFTVCYLPATTQPPQNPPKLRKNTPLATKINLRDSAEMILIPAGPFLMGDEDRKDNPRRTERTESYYIYKYPVTVKQYFQFCSKTGHAKPPEPDWGWRAEDPVVNVSWNDAQDYCKWASLKGRPIRLPTEKEWEKAARGTEGLNYPWGNDWDGSRCVNSVKPFDDMASDFL